SRRRHTRSKRDWSSDVCSSDLFYPADYTFVCPTELGDLADNYAEFQRLGVEIYSVSTDTHFTHKTWHGSSETIGKITYPMIGDPDRKSTRLNSSHVSISYAVFC